MGQKFLRRMLCACMLAGLLFFRPAGVEVPEKRLPRRILLIGRVCSSAVCRRPLVRLCTGKSRGYWTHRIRRTAM